VGECNPLIQKEDLLGSGSGDERGKCAVGVDVGATLAKIAIEDEAGNRQLELLSATSLQAVVERIGRLDPSSIGLTGGGAPRVAAEIRREAPFITEFDAWARGAVRLLPEADLPGEPFLLVSLGTGTSVVLVDGDSARRVGGTALGGGTVVGLGFSLVGSRNFAELCELARAGSRNHVDLLVEDIYRDGDLPLPGTATAAAFGKLSLPDDRRADFPEPSREDLAAGVMHLVGENVALVCGAISAICNVTQIVFGGTTLRGNTALSGVLTVMSQAIGRKPTILPDGEFAGALGALELGR
jgi:type II pantothenate kinase